MDAKESELLLRIVADSSVGVDITPESGWEPWSVIAYLEPNGDDVVFVLDVMAPEGEEPEHATAPPVASVDQVPAAVNALLSTLGWRRAPKEFTWTEATKSRLALAAWAK